LVIIIIKQQLNSNQSTGNNKQILEPAPLNNNSNLTSNGIGSNLNSLNTQTINQSSLLLVGCNNKAAANQIFSFGNQTTNSNQASSFISNSNQSTGNNKQILEPAPLNNNSNLTSNGIGSNLNSLNTQTINPVSIFTNPNSELKFGYNNNKAAANSSFISNTNQSTPNSNPLSRYPNTSRFITPILEGSFSSQNLISSSQSNVHPNRNNNSNSPNNIINNDIGVYRSFGNCNGKTVFINNHNQYYYINKSGKHQVIKTDCVLDEAGVVIKMSDFEEIYAFLLPMDHEER